jgi:hypothetical protein
LSFFVQYLFSLRISLQAPRSRLRYDPLIEMSGFQLQIPGVEIEQALSAEFCMFRCLISRDTRLFARAGYAVKDIEIGDPTGWPGLTGTHSGPLPFGTAPSLANRKPGLGIGAKRHELPGSAPATPSAIDTL